MSIPVKHPSSAEGRSFLGTRCRGKLGGTMVSVAPGVENGASDPFALALLHAIARDEAAGRRPARLTEPGQATWNRFRGRLGSAGLLQLLAEDGAVVHPIPFDPARLGGEIRLDSIDDSLVDQFLG